MQIGQTADIVLGRMACAYLMGSERWPLGQADGLCGLEPLTFQPFTRNTLSEITVGLRGLLYIYRDRLARKLAAI